ncbi:metal ABC transporter substrate-binding protein [Clostridioides difficile]|uniref:Periplasmic solute binding protein n=2 Tax=Clostridioides difficile TaxID=1496 RepID=A0AAX3GXS7_CLODI|nr:metal ABC transporter substrate-binding protein [Clostridioides difficile]AVD35351.1 ABC transporter substrate-binding protein [Clostridioides difficile]AVD41209.1 ABC transporter substrate-binding protein [Clostridioides difficile]AVD44711.1 ABC transporter substrate-binding protein [Clostridioides difficile]AXU67833.1 periplasmic solute binding protein [Clostridioides difficile]AXU90003.1 periplasmic solute binding protein [Clostridioides difficile]
MKRFVLLFCCSLLLLTGCSFKDVKKTSSNKKLSVYTSFYPMYDFAKKIGGTKVDVKNMTPAGIEPHDFEPTTNDIKGLSNADMFIYNGDNMEHWVNDVIQSLDNRNILIVKASDGIDLMKGEKSSDSMDPHTWLSIRNAKKELEKIKNAFCKKDPDNATYYEKNYYKYASEFDALDSQYKKELLPYKGRSIVVAHQAFGYLCKDYNLKQIAIEGLSPDSEPSPARMAEIIKSAKKNKIKVIFYEELVNPKVAETIAKETGSETKVLNTLEELSDKKIKEGEDYISVMKTNLQNLVYALSK